MVNTGTTLNLTTQFNVTDISTTYEILGTLNAGPNNNAFRHPDLDRHRNSVPGERADHEHHPVGGLLTISGGEFDIGNGSTVNITATCSMTASCSLSIELGSNNTLNISGTLTNNNSFDVDGNGDVANVGTLVNNANTTLVVGTGATLNLTNQFNVTDISARYDLPDLRHVQRRVPTTLSPA